MKRRLDEQQEKVVSSNSCGQFINCAENLTLNVSCNTPVVSHSGGSLGMPSDFVKTKCLPVDGKTNSINTDSVAFPVLQSRKLLTTVGSTGGIRPQIFSTEATANSPLVTIASTKAVELRTEVVSSAKPTVKHQGGDSMQTSVQSYHQMQASYQLPSGPVTNSNHNSTPTTTSLQHQVSTTGVSVQTTPQVQAHQQLQIHQAQAHHATSTSQVPAAAQQQQFQRLKVEDALSYLDKVKYKFSNQPQVYNDFLDIMKEFKSQSIDTPGVISRVSNLFKGHPELIVGFNTFLPPGYKIEVQSNEQVNVSMPGSGTPTILHPGNPTPTQQQSTSFYAAVDAEVVKRLMTFQAPASTAAISNQAERTPNTTTGNGPMSQHTYHQQASSGTPAPTSPLSANQLSPLHHPLLSGSNNSQSSQSQPVEFNHAINYVNKIKNRFQGQPDVYKQFLEILHTYQKEQRNLKEGVSPGNKPLTESEVYSQVAKLFHNEKDLLQEFGQFLPDANGAAAAAAIPSAKAMVNDHSSAVKKLSYKSTTGSNTSNHHQSNRSSQQVKRPSSLSQLQSKKSRLGTVKDVTLAEAGKYGTLNEYAFFDKVRKALRSQDVYENFLRCLVLFNKEVVSRGELVHLTTPFLSKFPELFKWFKDFIGYKESGVPIVEPISHRIAAQERICVADWENEVDYSACKRYGASYRALPKSFVQPKCSGRTALCKEVLNDSLVSFPSWSEDSTFVSSRKTQFEEYIYRCEDERFELDVVLETNLCTIRVLEAVQKKMARMTAEETSKFRLDDTLGGTSQVIHQRSIRRIYGDKSQDIIDGLKRNPVVAVPLVLRRLRAKEEEWREAQKGFNKIWKEQNEKYYLKSLDHQGINFKQNDIRNLRSKNFLNEIEMLYEERHDHIEEGANNNVTSGPHITLEYKDKSILDDAANLIIHHVKRQTGIHKEDKQKIKQFLKHLIPDMFFHPRQELSDDEIDDMDIDEVSSNDGAKHSSINSGNSHKDNVSISSTSSQERTSNKQSNNKVTNSTSSSEKQIKSELSNGDMSDSEKYQALAHLFQGVDVDEAYTLLYGNNNWYLFFRLHQILCDRLTTMYRHAVSLAEEEAKARTQRKEATSRALRLQPKQEYEVEEYYPAQLDMIKNVLDGNLENGQYEDMLRDMYGIHAYIAFSLDKVVINIVRQLQHLVCDEICIQCTELYLQESKSGATGGLCSNALQRSAAEVLYERKAEQKLSDENCFKIYIYKKDSKIAIELLDTDSEGSEDPVEVERWSEYIEKYIGDECISEELREQLSKKPVFLPRNVRAWRQQVKRQALEKLEKKNKDSKESNDSSDEIHSKSETDNKPPSLGVDDMDIVDGTQCKFNLNSFKMVFVVNSESYLYKRLALKRASQSHQMVSEKLNSKFHRWHNNWCRNNVSDTQEKNSNDWMMGNIDGLVSNSTVCLTDNDVNKPPYSKYNRYKVISSTANSTTSSS